MYNVFELQPFTAALVNAFSPGRTVTNVIVKIRIIKIQCGLADDDDLPWPDIYPHIDDDPESENRRGTSYGESSCATVIVTGPEVNISQNVYLAW